MKESKYRKLCTKCKSFKSLSDYHKNRSRPDGHQEWCKECLLPMFRTPKRREYARLYYKGNADLILDQRKEYRRRKKEAL